MFYQRFIYQVLFIYPSLLISSSQDKPEPWSHVSSILPPGVNIPSLIYSFCAEGSAFPLVVDFHRFLLKLTLSRFPQKQRSTKYYFGGEETRRGSSPIRM